MRDSWKLMCGVSAVLVAVWAAEAGAGLVVYGDRAAFEAALTHAKTYTFEVSDGFPQAPTDGNPGVPPTLTEWDGGAVRFFGFGDTPPSIQMSPPLSEFWPYKQFLAGVASVRFSTPQGAVGFQGIGGDVPDALITFRFADGTADAAFVLQRVSVAKSPAFIGVFSDHPVTGFDVALSSPELPPILNGPFLGIDNLTVQSNPEPGSCVLMVLGITLLVARRRR